MTQPSTISTLSIFARVAMRRAMNRTASLKLPKLKKSADNAVAAPRTATRHRSEQRSLLRRVFSLWLPLTSLAGMVGLSLSTMFGILGTVYLEEARTAAVLEVSSDSYTKLKTASQTTGSDERTKEMDLALANAFSAPVAWQSTVGKELAKQRFEQKGIAAFTPHIENDRWGGTLAYLSPEGRVRGMRAVGIYLAMLNLAVVCVVFGMMSKHVSGTDPTLVWLWQFPLSRRALFLAKLVEYVFDNPAVLVLTMFYTAAVMICGTPFLIALGIGMALGLSAGIASAALRLGAETILTQRVGRRTRGAIVGFITLIGSTAMFTCMMGCNAQFLVEGLVTFSNAIPEWCTYNVFSYGIGSDAMTDQRAAWWWIGPVSSVALGVLAVSLSVRLTARGLASPQDSQRTSERRTAATPSRRSNWGTIAWKELLQMRRQPEFVGQILAAPVCVGCMLYFTGYRNVMDMAVKNGATVCVAILVGLSYMLVISATQMLTTEFKNLWLLQCQPRSLADVVRGKARVWAAISWIVAVPVIATAIALRPEDALTILSRVPFLFASLWLVAEILFGLTALSASITNEQTVRFRRNLLLPLLVIGNTCTAIHSDSWWAQLGMLATLIVFNATVRERQMVELGWLSEPVEMPPKKVYPMHGVVVMMAFLMLETWIQIAIFQFTELSSTVAVSIGYFAAAVIVTVFTLTWLSENKLKLPQLPQGPALMPIARGLAVSCAVGCVVTLIGQWLSVEHQAAAYAINGITRSSDYDKWCVLAMWVIAAPVFEEWVLRGMLYRSLRRNWGVALSVAASAVLFATLHPAAGAIPLITLGVMTALTVEKTGRLWPSILVHAGYNFMIWCLWWM
jgi:membrane protease YdiL (CAAX protease family)